MTDLPYHHDWTPRFETSLGLRVKWFGRWREDPDWSIQPSRLASDLIWRAIRQAREKGKPVVASFSDVAASGGYYVASAADVIVSDPGTLTGSIGVVGGKMVMGGLYDKIGVKNLATDEYNEAEYLAKTKQ